jgi:maleylacetoacetate isomerase
MRLYQYFRSSASYRVRIALELKGLSYEQIPVHLLKGEQFADDYARANPARLVPMIEDDGYFLAQSLAIIEYLEERWPQPPLLPQTVPADRAWVRQLALSVACDIHPLNNLRVLKYLTDTLGLSEDQKNLWARNWIGLGFAALEAQISASPHRGRFSFGDAPGLVECFLVPQMFNASRFNLDFGPYPVLREIEQSCSELEAFRRAHPSAQPDAA